MKKPEEAAAVNATKNEIELTLGEIVELYNEGIGNLKLGKAGLNGYNKPVGERVILQPFALTDEVRQKIAHCRFILRPFFEEIYKEECARIICEVMDDETAVMIPADDVEKQMRYIRAEEKLLRVKHTVAGLHVFRREDFFRENKNPIPNECETALYPITESSPWRVKHLAPKPAAPVGGELT